MQLLHLQTVLRLVGGPGLTSLSSSLSYVSYMHLMPALQHLELTPYPAWHVEQPIPKLDLGALAAVSSLRVLKIIGTNCTLKYMEHLSQLKALVLTDTTHPVGVTAPCLKLPLSLTRLGFQMADWGDSAVEAGYTRPLAITVLHAFQGELRSLTLDPQFVIEFRESQLSTLACLQNLTHLKLGFFVGPTLGGRLDLASLQSLHLDTAYWSAGQHPMLNLDSCPNLQSLLLSYCGGDQVGSRMIDLRGITGCLASSLHLELDVSTEMRAIANFSGWRLRAVTIASPVIYTLPGGREWRTVQSVHDVLGALAGHVPARNVTVDDERLE